MKDYLLSIQGAILLGCVFGLLAVFVGVLLSETVRSWKIWRSSRNKAATAALALIALIVGGTKPMGNLIRWDSGLHDDGSEISTNDLRMITVKWTFDSWIPNQATFTLRAALASEPITDLFEVATVPITNRILHAMLERDATNYLFYAEQSFIPDAPVVTNGVYHLRCVGGNDVWVPIGAKIYNEAECISPPHENYLIDLIQGETP